MEKNLLVNQNCIFSLYRYETTNSHYLIHLADDTDVPDLTVGLSLCKQIINWIRVKKCLWYSLFTIAQCIGCLFLWSNVCLGTVAHCDCTAS